MNEMGLLNGMEGMEGMQEMETKTPLADKMKKYKFERDKKESGFKDVSTHSKHKSKTLISSIFGKEK